ncbi:MAG: helix-turn-helix domain-containing protein, partial [bacterium]
MAQNFVPDFMKKDDKATQPTEKPAAAGADTTAKAATQEAAEKPKKERKTKAKEMTPEHIQFVLGNVKNMSYTEMAEKTGLTKHQVNRILMDTKKNLRENTPEGSHERAKVEE